MSWRDEYQRKLVTAEEAVKVVKSGDLVAMTMGQQPKKLCEALVARFGELENVEILQADPLVDFGWFQPDFQKAFRVNVENAYRGFVRDAIYEKRADFTPNLYSFRFKPIDDNRPEKRDINVFMTVVAPPDDHGFCSFGHSVWNKPGYARRAKKVLVEVDENQIRTFGGNYIHISEIDYFVEHTPPIMSNEEVARLLASMAAEPRAALEIVVPAIPLQQRAELLPRLAPLKTSQIRDIARTLGVGEPDEPTKRIAELVSSLIKDGDTIQIGYSMVTVWFPRLGVFDNKHDLGWHSEIMPIGVPQMVEAGLFSGARKTIHRGKAVSTRVTVAFEEQKICHLNPRFELYDVEYINDVRTIAAHDNMVAMNGAISVDLTGQINVEVMPGNYPWNGTGGQPEFVIGSLLSKGGRSIHVLRSNAGTASRIVPTLPEGTPVAIPRSFADCIVTEYGIARLMGKSLRQRAQELIAIAHPDHRAELTRRAKELF
jgi:4-hydroxybutyrate CoA-transferase